MCLPGERLKTRHNPIDSWLRGICEPISPALPSQTTSPPSGKQQRGSRSDTRLLWSAATEGKIKSKPVGFSQTQTSAKKMGSWREDHTFCAQTPIHSSSLPKWLQILLCSYYSSLNTLISLLKWIFLSRKKGFQRVLLSVEYIPHLVCRLETDYQRFAEEINSFIVKQQLGRLDYFSRSKS